MVRPSSRRAERRCDPKSRLSPSPRAKSPQAEPKPDQEKPRKRAWIFLDFFVRFEAFQWVTSNPNQKNSFLGPFAPSGAAPPPRSIGRAAQRAGWFRGNRTTRQSPSEGSRTNKEHTAICQEIISAAITVTVRREAGKE